MNIHFYSIENKDVFVCGCYRLKFKRTLYLMVNKIKLINTDYYMKQLIDLLSNFRNSCICTFDKGSYPIGVYEDVN